MTSPDEMEQKIEHYSNSRSLVVESCLGVGTQGCVYVVTNIKNAVRLAVKIHDREIAYARERNVYLRMEELQLTEVAGHEIPQLVHFDDNSLALEMTIVSPPFCLDFGGAYLDRRPDYSPEVWRDWREQKAEDFEENWPAVQNILAQFEQYGIYIADVNPGNIRF